MQQGGVLAWRWARTLIEFNARCLRTIGTGKTLGHVADHQEYSLNNTDCLDPGPRP